MKSNNFLTTTIISWNVNGIRALEKKGFVNLLTSLNPDIFCIQETKACPEQLSEDLLKPKGYFSYYASAKRPGYSGVATFVKKNPISIKTLDKKEFDIEGRIQVLEYDKFTIVNAYFPNSRETEGERLNYKLAFCNAILDYINMLRKTGKNVILCGDYNIAHKAIDLTNPKQNEKNPGYLPEERAWMDIFISSGWVDTFRMFCQQEGHYTWWSYRFNARAKNIGWRLDYFCVNSEFKSNIQESTILPHVTGSDHAPILLKLR